MLAGYTSEAAGSAYQQWFEDDAAFLSFVREAMERSDFQANVSVEPTDRIVTLSTCAYVFDNARYVIHARLSPLGLAETDRIFITIWQENGKNRRI